MGRHPGPGHDLPRDGPPPLLPVLTLTEEELLVLTDGDLGVVPPRLHLPGPAEQEELVRAVALRSLMARGLVTPTVGVRADGRRGCGPGPSAAPADQSGLPGPEPDGVSWEAAEPLGLTLTLRALAPVVLGLQRVLGPRVGESPAGRPEAEPTTAVRYLHLHPEIAVIEDVTTEGMHSLLTVLPERYADGVADFIVPPEAVPGTGDTRRLADTGDTAVADLLTALGHPTVLVEVAVLSLARGDEALEDDQGGPVVTLMLALGPGGCFRSPDSVAYHPVDPQVAIRELLEVTLAGA